MANYHEPYIIFHILTEIPSHYKTPAIFLQVRIFQTAHQVMEYVIMDVSCAIIGFYTENADNKSATLALGAGSNVYFFRNLRPYFKFCLPQSHINSKEQDVSRNI